MFKLEKNTSYINSGNYFSKSLILQKQAWNHNSSFFLVESEKELENYKKILNYLFVPYKTLDNLSNIIDLSLNRSSLFLWTTIVLEKNFKILEQIKYESIYLKKDDNIDLDELIKKLVNLWYNFSEYGIKWSYKKSWDILSITSSDGKTKYDISFWWNTIEEINKTFIINEFKKETSNITEFYLWDNISLNDYEISDKKTSDFLDLLSNDTFKILDSLDFNNYYDKLNEKLDNYCSLDFVGNKKLNIKDLEINNLKIENIDDLKDILKKHKSIIFTKSSQSIKNFLEYNDLGNTSLKETDLNNLKSFSFENTYYICDDILSPIFTKKRTKKSISADIDLLLKIKPGDYIVHIEHGIGIFKQILKKELDWIVREYIEIEYANDDKLFVPITEVSRVNKYLWADNPKLTGLNTTEWEKKIKKAWEEAEAIATELIEIYAQRKISSGVSFTSDKKKEDEFKNGFPYLYTEDQNQAINDVLSDMEKQVPMDRLIVWDVWFWKTEIAFNAIYRSFINKKQSVLISPLVVLAYEHYEKALDRFKIFWMKIWVLTRLESTKAANETIRKLKTWELDLVVWTHKLLSDSILFKDLWLIVVDEEHKFWVADKEKIKSYKATIDVLSMSATPIPRSLNMALSSLKEISILKTPPFGRQDISTNISRYSENIIFEAWNREFERWWQMFFVHNRVSNIENFKKILQNIFPDKKIVITHGQLAWDQLEKRIIDFKHKKYDILLSTTVIENGIDFSNVNTIIINDAEKFGLSQIHQLRWRVGRSDKKWYCYLLYKKENLKEDTAKRLKTIVLYSYLWAWFELAIKDLEIRWGWDLLGFRQSGQVNQIGVNLFLKMIEEKIEDLRNKQDYKSDKKQSKTNNTNTKIDLNVSLSIADEYFAWELDKINFYREIETISDLEELESIIEDFKYTNNKLPIEASNLFNLLKIKLISSNYFITNIKKVGINYQIDFDENISIEQLKSFLDLDKEVKFIVVSINRLRTPTKSFASEQKFLEYLLQLFEKKIINKKIKLKKKI